MSKILVELGPAQESIIEELTHAGLFKTKAEAIRAGINELSEKYDAKKWKMNIKPITNPKIIAKIEKVIAENKKRGLKPLSMKEVQDKYPFMR